MDKEFYKDDVLFFKRGQVCFIVIFYIYVINNYVCIALIKNRKKWEKFVYFCIKVQEKRLMNSIKLINNLF